MSILKINIIVNRPNMPMANEAANVKKESI